MGFKKTSEGRVFFQGSNGRTANDPRQQPVSPAAAAGQQGTQIQILTLLRALNDKLKATQAERNDMRTELDNYRRAVEQLQGKAARGERAEQLAQDTFRELAETRRLLLQLEEKTDKADQGFSALKAQIVQTTQTGEELVRRQSALEKGVGGYGELVKRIQDTESKQDDMSRKIEETSSQQVRLVRQIEKAVEDRARFMRKIERIEETVIQTRDALSAKAMVLLTDQGVPGAYPASSPEALHDNPVLPGLEGHAGPMNFEDLAEGDAAAWWPRSAQLQAAGIFLLVVGGILAGWAVSQWQQPRFSDIGDFSISEQSTEEKPVVIAADEMSGWEINRNTAPFTEEALAAQEPSAVAPAPVSQAQEEMKKADDIGTIDLKNEQQLLSMLESNPDALAAELNKIEPGIAEEETANAEEIKTASLSPAAQEVDIAPAPLSAPSSPKEDLKNIQKADPALPETVKKIEEQAFAGVAEAQHDLAAIYTAGHAGVKQDYGRAFFWFRQAAEAGIANAAYNLGVLYHQGLGTRADITQAVTWYKTAADLGHPEAAYNLGIAYIEGVGVPYDAKKAEGYFKKAAGAGIMEASYNLGLIYENGLLGNPQPDEALAWYKEAADKGSPEAKAALDQLAQTLGIKRDDVNRLVEGIKVVRGEDASSSSSQSKLVSSPVEKSEELVAQIQDYLMGAGLYPGPADGSGGPLTEDAIRAYQALNSLQITGKPSNDLLVHMLSNTKTPRAN